MREKKREKIKKGYFQLRRQASLSRMINGELASSLNETIDKTIDKLEIKFPEFREAYARI